MNAGERQVAPNKEGIRRDHVARYEFAAKLINRESRVIDFACGVGYGTRILADAGHRSTGFDNDREAIKYAMRHYGTPRTGFVWADGAAPPKMCGYDAAVCFETIEHIEDPRPLLRSLRDSVDLLIASVPNENVLPWQIAPGITTAYHHRHYTRVEFDELLESCGWTVTARYGQQGPKSEVEPDIDGRTLIAVCKRSVKQLRHQRDKTELLPSAQGKHISIVGLGPSSAQYVDLCKRLGGRHKYCDQTWAINALGDVIAHDIVFHMDDVRIQQIRADAAPESNIAGMLEWLKTHAGPVITSRKYPDRSSLLYPGLVEFPLEAVVNAFPNGYFNSTAAYAVAYAIYGGAAKISLFGCDFTYPDAHDAEKGRACVEFWLGIAAARGIKIAVPKTTSLLDALHTQAERFYGYDCVDLEIKRKGDQIGIDFVEKKTLPSAEEIENSYDHTRHPSPLCQQEFENETS